MKFDYNKIIEYFRLRKTEDYAKRRILAFLVPRGPPKGRFLCSFTYVSSLRRSIKKDRSNE